MSVVAAGEILLDLFPDEDKAGAVRYVPRPGGAPANLAATVRALGREAALVAALGRDGAGRQLARALERAGVDGRWLEWVDAPTPLAVVDQVADQPRYQLYWAGTALDHLAALGVRGPSWRGVTWLAVSGVAMMRRAARQALLGLVADARVQGVGVVLDVNRRPAGDTDQTWWEAIRPIWTLCALVKMTEEEWHRLGAVWSIGNEGMEGGGPRFFCVTCGREGSLIRRGAPPFPLVARRPGIPVEPKTPVGAGDVWLGALLAALDRNGATAAHLDGLSARDWEGYLELANRAGALAVARREADWGALPTWADVAAVTGGDGPERSD